MKKNKRFVWGMAALALTFIVGLAGCGKKEAGGAAGAANVVAKVLKSLPAGAIVASKPEDFKYDLTADGNGIVIQEILVDDPVAVIVPAEIEGYPVVEFVGVGWNPDIISIILPDTITKLGESAFSSTKITEFTIPPKITEIPEGCFRASSLTSITIPEGIILISVQAFMGCSELTTVNLPSHLIEYPNFSYYSSLDDIEWYKASIGNSSLYTSSEREAATREINSLEARLKAKDEEFYGDNGAFSSCPKLSLAVRKAITDSGYTGEF